MKISSTIMTVIVLLWSR